MEMDYWGCYQTICTYPPVSPVEKEELVLRSTLAPGPLVGTDLCFKPILCLISFLPQQSPLTNKPAGCQVQMTCSQGGKLRGLGGSQDNPVGSQRMVLLRWLIAVVIFCLLLPGASFPSASLLLWGFHTCSHMMCSVHSCPFMLPLFPVLSTFSLPQRMS